MRLERSELVHFALPMASAFRTSVSEVSLCEGVLVCVQGAGITGWGEVVADTRPSYSAETVTTALHVLRDFLLPEVLRAPFDSVEAAVARFDWVRGHPMAKAGLEMALFDWWGRATGLSLREMLGGTRPSVAVGVSVGLQPSIRALETELSRFATAGYTRFKVKVTPDWLEAPLAAARATLGQTMALAADANGAFKSEEAERLRGVADQRLQFLEQPLGWEDLVSHAALQKTLGTPLCLDESIPSLSALDSAIALKALDVLNVKPGRVGGLLPARACLESAHRAGLQTFVGGMLETAIGRAANVALASLLTVTLPSDLSASARYFDEDLAEPFVLGTDSTLTVPTSPGLGVVPNPAVLARVTRAREVVAPA